MAIAGESGTDTRAERARRARQARVAAARQRREERTTNEREKREKARQDRIDRATHRVADRESKSLPGDQTLGYAAGRPFTQQDLVRAAEEERRRRSARVSLGLYPGAQPSTSGISKVDTGILGNALDEGGGIARGLPMAGVTVLRAGVHDLLAPPNLSGDKPDVTRSRTYKEVVKPQLDYYEGRYVEPFREHGFGGVREIGREFYERPVSGSLDLLGGASAATKLGMVAKTRSLDTGLPSPRYVVAKPEGSAGHAVQLPTSPNTLTTWGQRLLDKYETMYAPSLITGKASKAKSRQIKMDRDRARGQAEGDIKQIRHPVGFTHVKVNRRLRPALFYEAQAPLEAVIADLRSKGLDQQANRLEVARAQRDKLGPKERAGYDAALESMRHLADDTTAIAIRAGLPPEAAAARPWLLARELGVDPGIAPIYVPHKSRPGRPSDERMGSTRVGTGQTAVPANIRKRNKLKLYEQGRLRADPETLIEHWHRLQTMEFHNQVKDYFGGLAQPILDGQPNPGWLIYNRNGKVTPETWKDVVEKADDDSLIRASQNYVDDYVQPAGSVKAQEWVARNPDVKQLDPAIARQFFNEYVGPQGTMSGASKASDTFDLINGLVRTSLLYANPAYIPANFAGNLAFGAIHQGPFLPGNLLAAGKIMLHDPELSNLIRAEVGHKQGATAALSDAPLVSATASAKVGRKYQKGVRGVRKAEQQVAGKVGALPDDGPRIAGWLFEAKKAKYRTREQQIAVLKGKTKKHREDRLELNSRANKAMVDFNLLGPAEKMFARKFLFVWPWIRGAAAWAGKTPLDRPVRSALLANQSERDADKNAKLLGNVEAYLESNIPLGGGPVPSVIPTGSLSPTGVISGFADVLQGKRYPGDYVNPLVNAGYRVSQGEVEYGDATVKVGTTEAAKQNALGLLPLTRLHPRESDLYPEDKAWWGTIKHRVLRGLPIKLSLEEARSRAGYKTGEKAGLDAAWERGVWEKIAKANGVTVPGTIRRALQADMLIQTAYQKRTKAGEAASPESRLLIYATAWDQLHPGSNVAATARGIEPDKVDEGLRRMRQALGLNELSEARTRLNLQVRSLLGGPGRVFDEAFQ